MVETTRESVAYVLGTTVEQLDKWDHEARAQSGNWDLTTDARAKPPTETDITVLRFIARGGPGSPPVENESARGALGMSEDDYGACIAHLVANRLIEATWRTPGIIARMFGAKERYYAWASHKGRGFLASQ
jgi:hypothetical protein